MKSKKFVLAALALIVALSVNVATVSAAEFRFAKEGQNITVADGESVKNLYAVGNVVSINSEIESDLHTAGNVTTVEKDVEHNFCGVGGTIVIKGDVGNNVHVAAGTVVVQGKVMEDLFIAGGNVLIARSAVIGGDLIVAGGTVDIEGPIEGDVFIGAGDVVINSKIGGAVKMTADSVRIGEFAQIKKKLKYTSSKKATIHKDAKVLGKVDFVQKTVNSVNKASTVGGMFGILAVFLLLKMATYIVVGLALVYLFKNTSRAVVVEGLGNVWANLGVGFAVLFLTPVVVVILAITMIGFYLAGLLTLLYIFLLAISSVMASIVLGSLLVKILRKKENYEVSWLEVVVGVIVLKVIWFIPLVGWLTCSVFTLMSIGAISKLMYRKGIKS